jgi:hypothetical protein
MPALLPSRRRTGSSLLLCCRNARSFDFSGNRFSGSVSTSLGDLVSLRCVTSACCERCLAELLSPIRMHSAEA